MYALISLYIGYAIYLWMFFRAKKHDFFSKKIAIALGIKLAILTLLYFVFFNQKLTTSQRIENLHHLITNK
jgi:uncharacterized membrane protein